MVDVDGAASFYKMLGVSIEKEWNSLPRIDLKSYEKKNCSCFTHFKFALQTLIHLIVA